MAKRENVTSREYKVMLRARLFDGDEQRMHSAIDAFWTDLTAALAAMDIPCEGSFTQVKARRLIRFFDTDEHRINADQYIVREREDLDTGEREVTLLDGEVHTLSLPDMKELQVRPRFPRSRTGRIRARFEGGGRIGDGPSPRKRFPSKDSAAKFFCINN